MSRHKRTPGHVPFSAARLRPNNLHKELLVRAARIRGAKGPLHAVDATAGLGEDSLLLAAAGFTVTLFERDAAIATYLRDALAQAANLPVFSDAISRMTVIEQDSIEGLRTLETQPDIVYLDPMFPEKRKKAATNKKMQLFRSLERPCTDEEAVALVNAAIGARPRKVIVKRPLKGPYLAGVKPSYSLSGKVIRYDVLVP